MPGKTSFRLLVIAALFTLVIPLAATTPGAAADGDDDPFTIPEKVEPKYPNLGSMLSRLAAQVERGRATAQDAAGDAPVHRAESVAVTIHLSGNVDGVAQFLEDFGGDPRNVGEDYIEAYVPVTLLGPASEQSGVLRVRAIIPPQPAYGEYTSQGVQAHLSAAWNQAGYSGQGVKVGIIDLGFEGYIKLMGTELPDTVLARCYIDIGRYTRNQADCQTGSSHGTAVAETVVDIAPEVSLYIADPSTQGDLKNAVRWMASQGVTVINHSVIWGFDGPGDGSSPHGASPLKTVDLAVNRGIIWVNAAGNYAEKTWFGTYSDRNGNGLIEFNGVDDETSYITPETNGTISVQLRWEDRWDRPTRDLDLHIWDFAAREYTRHSRDNQSGESGQIPYESLQVDVIPNGEYSVVVSHHGGSAPGWIQVAVDGAYEIEHHTDHGSIYNPAESANLGMLAVGAAHYYDLNTIASYSSRGPTPDGRVKPDIVGTACGETASYLEWVRNSSPCWFSGTSQASPHVAGLAALVRQRFPGKSPVQVAEYLKYHAQQRETPDPNNTWGHGFAVLPSPDRAALEALYHATGGANWLENDNWLSNAPIGEWHGVTTGAGGRVTGLSLRGNQLSGEIPPELGNLASLTRLGLDNNQLSGEIPPELGNLANLTGLWLYNNQLSGAIPPELGNLASLTGLYLGGNQLSGEIPPQLGNLASLTSLDLGNNQLSGEIPPELGNLASLTSLWLINNQLTGEIPPELGNLASLTRLSLPNNQLSGAIPPELGNLASLEDLYLYNNQLSGAIPPELGNLANLRQLHLGSNQLSGAIPPELGNLASLTGLYLGNNQLSGEIPPQLGNLASLTSLDLGNNQLSGEIPPELGNLASLTSLWLINNQLTGEIPPELGNLASLTRLSLPNNQLTGEIPPELGNLASLEDLYLYNNQLSGEIPPELGNLASLTGLSLFNNQLTGEIPPELGNLANLTGLWLYNNQLSGEIPPQLGSLTRLEWMRLDENQLTGSIPAELGQLNNLEQLYLNDNELTGEIPSELGRLVRRVDPHLAEIYLSGNELTGCIPHQLQSVLNHDFPGLNLPFCASGDPLITRYDGNGNGAVDRNEVIAAINDYLDGVEGITRADVIRLINLYLDG